MTHPNLSDAIAALETLSSDRDPRDVARQRDLARATWLIVCQGEWEEGFQEGQDKGLKDGEGRF